MHRHRGSGKIDFSTFMKWLLRLFLLSLREPSLRHRIECSKGDHVHKNVLQFSFHRFWICEVAAFQSGKSCLGFLSVFNLKAPFFRYQPKWGADISWPEHFTRSNTSAACVQTFTISFLSHRNSGKKRKWWTFLRRPTHRAICLIFAKSTPLSLLI